MHVRPVMVPMAATGERTGEVRGGSAAAAGGDGSSVKAVPQ